LLKSPIAQRMAAEDAARLARLKPARREITIVDQNLRLVDDRPLVETARLATRVSCEGGLVDAYARRTQAVRIHKFEPVAIISEPVLFGRSTPEHYRKVHAGAHISFEAVLAKLALPSLPSQPAFRVATATVVVMLLILGTLGTTLALGG
jgi:hypothetical protein